MKYYLAGLIVKNENSDYEQFELLKPSGKDKPPYITVNPDSRAMYMAGETCALYEYKSGSENLINIHKEHYERNGKQPDIVPITKRIEEQINNAINGRYLI